jgi:hypothetical protein
VHLSDPLGIASHAAFAGVRADLAILTEAGAFVWKQALRPVDGSCVAVPREDGPRKWSGGARGFVARPRKLRAQRI